MQCTHNTHIFYTYLKENYCIHYGTELEPNISKKLKATDQLFVVVIVKLYQ